MKKATFVKDCEEGFTGMASLYKLDKNEHHRTTIGYYMHLAEGDYHEFSDVNDGTIYQRLHIAQLDAIDEIGKPPSYFINRDNRHT